MNPTLIPIVLAAAGTAATAVGNVMKVFEKREARKSKDRAIEHREKQRIDAAQTPTIPDGQKSSESPEDVSTPDGWTKD